MKKEKEIKILLRENRITQSELADLLGVTPSKLSHQLNGYSRPDRNLLNKALKILNNEDVSMASISDIIADLKNEGMYTNRHTVHNVKNKLGIKGEVGDMGVIYFTPKEKDRIITELKNPGKADDLITYQELTDYINKNGGTTQRGAALIKRNIADYVYENRIRTIKGKLEVKTAKEIAEVFFNYGNRKNFLKAFANNETKVNNNKNEVEKGYTEQAEEVISMLQDDRDRYKKLYEELKQKTEKKHRFLFWKW